MKSGLVSGADRKSSLRVVSKKEEGPGEEAKETDPLLSSNPPHFRSTIRSRRSSKSPAALMNNNSPEDRYTANVGTFNSTEDYSEGDYELHTDSATSESSQQNQKAVPQQETRRDDRAVFHLRRTNAVYRDSTASRQPLDDDGEPPLLEISEEIYAVRKSALQVMKPLIGSWVSVKPLFLCTLLSLPRLYGRISNLMSPFILPIACCLGRLCYIITTWNGKVD